MKSALGESSNSSTRHLTGKKNPTRLDQPVFLPQEGHEKTWRKEDEKKDSSKQKKLALNIGHGNTTNPQN